MSMSIQEMKQILSVLDNMEIVVDYDDMLYPIQSIGQAMDGRGNKVITIKIDEANNVKQHNV